MVAYDAKLQTFFFSFHSQENNSGVVQRDCYITLSKDLLVTKKKQKGQQNGTPGCQSSILEINWRNIVVHCVTMQLLIASTVYEVY